jgi:histidinol-phosphate aminotransferase
MNRNIEQNLQDRGFSRRQLGRVARIVTGGAAALPFFNEFALAQQAQRASTRGAMPSDAVRISSNENPLGPCQDALDAIYKVAKFGGRYSPFNEQGEFIKAVAEVDGVKPSYIAPYAGSSDPLHRAVCAFTSPPRSFVMGDPGYEAGARTAEFIGSKVHRIPLRKDFYTTWRRCSRRIRRQA